MQRKHLVDFAAGVGLWEAVNTTEGLTLRRPVVIWLAPEEGALTAQSPGWNAGKVIDR